MREKKVKKHKNEPDINIRGSYAPNNHSLNRWVKNESVRNHDTSLIGFKIEEFHESPPFAREDVPKERRRKYDYKHRWARKDGTGVDSIILTAIKPSWSGNYSTSFSFSIFKEDLPAFIEELKKHV